MKVSASLFKGSSEKRTLFAGDFDGLDQVLVVGGSVDQQPQETLAAEPGKKAHSDQIGSRWILHRVSFNLQHA